MLTETAVSHLERYSSHGTFLRKAIDRLTADPEPDGLTKFWSDKALPVGGALLFEVYPFRIAYRLEGEEQRVTILSIVVHPTRL